MSEEGVRHELNMVFGLLLFIFFLVYRYISEYFSRWKRLGVTCVPFTFNKRHINEVTRENYARFRHLDFFGTCVGGKPALVVNNLETVRAVLDKDFNSFMNRHDSNVKQILDGGPIDQVWLRMMTSLSGQEWKEVRSTFSPIFTSFKMKAMLRFIKEVSSCLKEEFGRRADSGKEFELKEEFGKFSIDSISTCAFGINPNSFQDKKNTFVRNAEPLFARPAWLCILSICRLVPGVSTLHKLLGINIINPKQTKFFQDIIARTIRGRLESGERHNDLIDLMIDCINDTSDSSSDRSISSDSVLTGVSEAGDQEDMQVPGGGGVKSGSRVKLDEQAKRVKLDEQVVLSTSLMMLIAGYDTTSVTLSYLAYYLAKHPEIQTKLQREVDMAYQESGDELPDYEVINKLPYTEMCILETLRLQPPLGTIARTCTNDTQIPNFDHEIRKHDKLLIPVSGIHRDDRYYPNPDQFNPDNFSKEARQARNPFTFIGFGKGPRACLGMRFAMLESKVALLEILHNFTFLPSARNPDELVLDPTKEMGYPQGGLYTRLERRRRNTLKAGKPTH